MNEDNSNEVWENVPINDYLSSGCGTANQITVGWISGLSGDAKLRRCVIRSTS
jgi:hypothetical protein